MPSELAVLVPTRGRPENIRKVISAWDFTNAWDVADLVLIVDADDPEIEGYRDVAAENPLVKMIVMAVWMPMVHKLNMVAKDVAEGWGTEEPPFAIGFAGDDHLPQTIGWAQRYLATLHELRTGMVYGDDGYQGANLSTEWAVTADAVRVLGRMVPPPVEHMYCDNAMMDLFGGAGALVYLPEIRIEHMHPIAGKAESDDQYKRVNHRDQFKKDKAAYDGWRRSGMATDIAAIRSLRPGYPDVRPTKAPSDSRLTPGSMPRHVPPRPRGSKPVSRFGIPRHFKKVRGATPDEIGVTLADFASQVPSDQAIVELGVFQGRTALLMAWGARQGQGAHVWGIDAWDLPGNTYGPPFNEEGSRTWANYNVMALGYNRAVTLVQGFSTEQAAAWDGPDIGLLFIDDDHSYEGARSAVTLWSEHLAPGAVIAVDDYGHPDWPGVAEAVDALVEEGFLAPVEIYHDRLAVTRLAGTEVSSAPTAITSEGVSPSPYPAVGDQVAVPPVQGGIADIGPAHTVSFEDAIAQADPEPVLHAPGSRVATGELGGVPVGTMIEDLNLGQLRALSRNRGIVLGKRKDLKADILQALRDGE